MARSRDATLVALIPVLALLAPAAIIIASGSLDGRAASDQVKFHEPVIRSFAQELPTPRLGDYASATTPAYHLALAVVARWIIDSSAGLQAVGAIFSAILAWLLGRRCARGTCCGAGVSPVRVTLRSALIGVAASLPFVASLYVIGSAGWLLPDNAGWLFVLATLLLALSSAPGAAPKAAGALLVLVLVRQVHLWAAAPIWAAAWLDRRQGRASQRAHEARRVFLGVVGTLPAFVVVACFTWLWKGLVPPSFQGQYPSGVNPAAPAFILALIGGFGVFFAWPLIASVRHPARRWIVVGATAGLLAALVVPTSFDQAGGRWSGLWNIARHLPAPGERSVLIALLSAMGGAMVAAWALVVPRREALILGMALAGFIAAQSASHELWQRYSEPFVLMVLALAGSTLAPTHDWRRAAGPLVLAGILSAFAMWTLF